jgi:hypothetical protein
MIKYNGPQILLIISATFLSFNPPKKKDDFLGNKRRSSRKDQVEYDSTNG